MELSRILNYLQYAAQFLAAGTAFLLVLKVRVPRWWNWSVAFFGMTIFVILGIQSAEVLNDLLIFWRAGGTILGGGSPYDDPLFLNPPNTLWFFTGLGLVPWQILSVVVMGLNLIAYAGLAFLGWDTLRRQDQTKTFALEADAVGVCAALMAMSLSARYGLALGQLSALVAVVLFGALWFQARGRPVAAGVCFLMGQIKIGSMLPFLLLFLRRRDVATWITMIVGGLALTLVGAAVPDWLDLCRDCLRNIAALGEPGMVNDISFVSPVSYEVLGPDHLLYRLGVREKTMLQLGQAAFILAGSCWIGWLLYAKPSWSRAAICAIVACFSDLFLYHRFYSTVILALPLVYALGRARQEAPGRWYYLVAFLACIGILYMRVAWLGSMTIRFGGECVVNRLVQALVLPYPTWLILTAMFAIALGESRRFKARLAA